MKIFYSLLILLFICNPSYAKRVDEMDRLTSPDITSDLIYIQDVSDTSENSHGTGKGMNIKNLLKAAKINVDGTNVGINTVTPTQQLEVVGTVKATAFIGDGSGLTGVSGSGSISDEVYGAGWDGDTTSGASKNAIYDKIETIGSTSGGWTDSGSAIYTTTSTDNVGIGTSNPQFLLDVNGPVRMGGNGNLAFANSIILNASVSNILGITGGNVGIGSTNPQKTLDVSGTGRFSSTLSASSITATGLTSGECVQTTTGGLLTTTGSACGSGGSITIGTTSPMTGAGSGTSFTLGVDQSKLTLSSIGGAVTDAQVPNTITIDNATTASALATNPTACGSGDFVIDIAADGTLTCDTPSGGGGGVGIGTINPGTVGALTKYVSSTVIDDSPVLFEGGSNIGIGTTGPTQKLEVSGTVKATTFSGSGSGLTGTAASLTAGNVTTNANLTGGVTSVGNAATVVTNANLTGDVTSSGNATTLSSTYKGWTDGGTNIYPTATTDNIGIGTTTPFSDTKLTVKGSASTGTDDFIGLFIENGKTPDVASLAGVAPKSIMVQGDAGAYYLGRDITNDIEFIMGTSTLGAGFGGTSSNHPFQIRTNNTIRMQAGTDGNVGIGTINPNARLTVMGTGTGATPIQTWRNSSSTQRMVVMDNGTVGIGTAAPGSALDVAGTITATGFKLTSSPTNGYVLTSDASGSGTWQAASGASGWTDGGTTVYPTTTTDNVGIGTFTPVSGAILTIKGTIAGADAGQPFAITNANVGIGTTTAGSLLTVGSTGSFQVDTSGNTRVGIGTTTAGTIICVKSISSGTAVLGYCTGSLTNSICGTCN